MLGEESEDDEEGLDSESDDDDDEDDESDEEEEEQMQIKDETETNLVNLRRTIYLTIMSSVDFEEAGHKLLKIKLEPGQEVSLESLLAVTVLLLKLSTCCILIIWKNFRIYFNDWCDYIEKHECSLSLSLPCI